MTRIEMMTDAPSAADAERLAELIHKLWLKTKPSHEAQGIRAALSTAVDDVRFPTWALEQLPDHVWNLIDVAVQRTLDARDAALREARAEIGRTHRLLLSARLRAQPSARMVDAAFAWYAAYREYGETISAETNAKLAETEQLLRTVLAEYDAAPPEETRHLTKDEQRIMDAALRRSVKIVDAAPADDGWRPIETAPKDGTIFDVWLGNASKADIDFYCTRGTRRSPGWHWFRDKFRPCAGLTQIPVFVEPTHWRSLPPPPTRSQEI